MKRTVCAMLTLVLALALCATAIAEVYTHPEAGYGFTIPEGWLAIDGENAQAVLDVNAQGADFSDMIAATLEQVKGMPIVLLYESDKDSPVFRNNINVTLQDLGGEADISEILPYGGAFAEGLAAALPEYTLTFPMDLVELGPWVTALMGGEYVLNGMSLAIWQVRLISGTILYEITLTALADEIEPYAEVLGALVATFTAP